MLTVKHRQTNMVKLILAFFLQVYIANVTKRKKEKTAFF